jgi:hypothetical protein
MSFRVTLALALAASVVSFLVPAWGPQKPYVPFATLALSILWLILATYAIARFRKRGLWTLIGALPAMFCSLYFAVEWTTCGGLDCI